MLTDRSDRGSHRDSQPGSHRQVDASSSWLDYLSWAVLIAACAFLLISLIAYSLGEPFSGSGFIHSLRMQPPFADLRYLTANAECGVDLDAYYRGLVIGCDPAGRTYRFDYPPMSIWLGRLLQVKGSHTALIAVSTGVSVVVVILLLLRDSLARSWRWRLLGSAIMVSIPVQSALERGNIDLMLFLMMILLAWLLSRPYHSAMASRLSGSLGFALTLISISLKIYPLFGIIGLACQPRFKRSFQARVLWDSPVAKAVILAASVAGLLAASSYLLGVGNLIKEGGLRSHGLLAFGYMNKPLVEGFGINIARIAIRLLFLCKLVSLLTGVLMAYKVRLSDGHRALPWSDSVRSHAAFADLNLMVMTSIWMGCYITTINYDYRFIFLVPILGRLCAMSCSPQLTRGQRRWTHCLVVSMIVVFLAPLLLVGYTPFGMALIKVVEPLTEFLLIPLFAGSLFAFLLNQTWLSPRPQAASPLMD